MHALQRVHRQDEVRLQILLQRFMQVAELLRTAGDLRDIAAERDEVRRFHDLYIDKLVKCPFARAAGITHIEGDLRPARVLRFDGLPYPQQAHHCLPLPADSSVSPLVMPQNLRGRLLERPCFLIRRRLSDGVA